MNSFQQVVVIWTVFAGVILADPPGGYYRTKYDTLDVEDVLNNKRIVYNYAACLLNRGPCPPQGNEIKRILPEALETNCLRCTDKQKEVILRTIKRLKDEYANIWAEVSDYYDPRGEYFRKFEESLSQTVPIEDQVNLLSNRFGDDDEANNIAPPATVPSYVYSVTTSTTTSKFPTTTTIRTEKVSSTTTMTRKLPLFAIWNFQPTPMNNHQSQRPAFGLQKPFFRPLVNVDAGINILGSISDIGNKVLKAGSQVAGMVLSAFTRN